MTIGTRSMPLAVAVAAWGLGAGTAAGQVKLFGDKDVCNTGTYGSEPTAGAALVGLAPGTVTLGTTSFAHGFPFSPAAGDFPETDQIYVGNVQTAQHDGYAAFATRDHGPQVFSLSYDDLLVTGRPIVSLTLGIMADDFQRPVWGQPFVVSVNGADVAPLTAALNSLDQTGPRAQFVSVGIDRALLMPSNVLTLAIDQVGDGGDGWAVDFLTIGLEAAPIGDANLNGRIDPDDFALTDRGMAQGLTGWSNGDFDGSGGVNAQDYQLLDQAWKAQLGSSAPWGVVPEPNMGGILATVTGLAGTWRRRRRAGVVADNA